MKAFVQTMAIRFAMRTCPHLMHTYSTAVIRGLKPRSLWMLSALESTHRGRMT